MTQDVLSESLNHRRPDLAKLSIQEQVKHRLMQILHQNIPVDTHPE
jgi:hypothetical protein